jgi:hypothetical protein
MNSQRPYGIYLFDDLHMYFPAILYNPEQFPTTQTLLHYIQTQVRYHTDIFTRNQQMYAEQHPPQVRSPPSLPRRHGLHTTETIEITPIFTAPLIGEENSLQTRINNSLSSLSNTILLNELYNMIQTPLRRREPNLEPVLVVPSVQQVENATTLRIATDANDRSDQACSICQDGYTDGQAIRSIRHCNHSFHKSCIDTWFERNVRCPVCRYDIRDHSA